ncbi:DUF4747 family protein [Mesorhizobium sp. M0622]|uniref:DUF4747 family protein n=1 Tax=Mesorhizobium sp. M0622 TaxID=2956975 RepID=UPI0033385105
MTRKLKMSAGVLNIRLHPHSPELYASYFSDIFRYRVVGYVHGDRRGMLSLIDRTQEKSGKISGVLTTFVNVDLDGTWFNSESLEPATEDQVSKVNIPNNLKPNSASYYFDFDIKTHRLYVQTYSHGKALTPHTIQRLFNSLARDHRISKRYGEAKITLLQDKESLKSLFSIPRITEIVITIMRPNPDIFADDFEATVEGHLEAINGRSVQIKYQAEPGGSLVPNKEIREVSEVGADNGLVEVTGRDDTGAVKKSTASYPVVLQTRYDPDAGERNAFLSLVRNPAHKAG